jgi:hypothetical protein
MLHQNTRITVVQTICSFTGFASCSSMMIWQPSNGVRHTVMTQNPEFLLIHQSPALLGKSPYNTQRSWETDDTMQKLNIGNFEPRELGQLPPAAVMK